MTTTRAQKAEAIQQLSETVGKAPHAFLVDFKGLTVPAVTDLRRQIKGAKSEYVVVKNSLVLRAIHDGPLASLSEHFTGMTGIAYTTADAVILAKVLHQFGKTNPAVKVKAALLDGKVVPASSLETLASLPSRKELVAKLLGVMQSPVRRLVTVLAAPHRNVAATLAAVARKKEEEKASA